MQRQPQSPRLVLAALVAGALLLAASALGLTATGGNAVFGYVANIQAILAIIAWAALAWLARRLVVGRIEDKPSDSLALFMWGGFRVCLLLATVVLLVGWLIGLAMGHALQPALLQAVVLMVVVTAVTGIIGTATVNSWLAIRHWRRRKSVTAFHP